MLHTKSHKLCSSLFLLIIYFGVNFMTLWRTVFSKWISIIVNLNKHIIDLKQAFNADAILQKIENWWKSVTKQHFGLSIELARTCLHRRLLLHSNEHNMDKVFSRFICLRNLNSPLPCVSFNAITLRARVCVRVYVYICCCTVIEPFVCGTFTPKIACSCK